MSRIEDIELVAILHCDPNANCTLGVRTPKRTCHPHFSKLNSVGLPNSTLSCCFTSLTLSGLLMADLRFGSRCPQYHLRRTLLALRVCNSTAMLWPQPQSPADDIPGRRFWNPAPLAVTPTLTCSGWPPTLRRSRAVDAVGGEPRCLRGLPQVLQPHWRYRHAHPENRPQNQTSIWSYVNCSKLLRGTWQVLL